MLNYPVSGESHAEEKEVNSYCMVVMLSEI